MSSFRSLLLLPLLPRVALPISSTHLRLRRTQIRTFPACLSYIKFRPLTSARTETMQSTKPEKRRNGEHVPADVERSSEEISLVKGDILGQVCLSYTRVE